MRASVHSVMKGEFIESATAGTSLVQQRIAPGCFASLLRSLRRMIPNIDPDGKLLYSAGCRSRKRNPRKRIEEML